jgi:hypothetical protein
MHVRVDGVAQKVDFFLVENQKHGMSERLREKLSSFS